MHNFDTSPTHRSVPDTMFSGVRSSGERNQWSPFTRYPADNHLRVLNTSSVSGNCDRGQTPPLQLDQIRISYVSLSIKFSLKLKPLPFSPIRCNFDSKGTFEDTSGITLLRTLTSHAWEEVVELEFIGSSLCSDLSVQSILYELCNFAMFSIVASNIVKETKSPTCSRSLSLHIDIYIYTYI